MWCLTPIGLRLVFCSILKFEQAILVRVLMLNFLNVFIMNMRMQFVHRKHLYIKGYKQFLVENRTR